MAVIGGAVAGAETAGALAASGAEVVVFEQNPRPYGKIEDGLPRWHVHLRRKEYESISEHLSKPGVHFVPKTGIGRDIPFAELVKDWGFSGVVLACGAWRDRPLPVEGADAYIDKGLIYQNPFIIWFNHANEADYRGQRFEPRDGALVVGGGLASIVVVKALMLETVRAKLRERGIDEPMLELEVKGIPKVLARHGLEFEALGLEGCTLFYRRDLDDMPLVEMPDDADEKRAEKVRGSRRKLLEKAMEKYRFMSIDWVEMARREITQLLATKDLAGIQFTLCEEFTEPPSDLRRDGAATIGFYVRVDNGRVEIGDRPVDNADLKFVSTYDDALAIARDPDAPAAQPSAAAARAAARARPSRLMG